MVATSSKVLIAPKRLQLEHFCKICFLFHKNVNILYHMKTLGLKTLGLKTLG